MHSLSGRKEIVLALQSPSLPDLFFQSSSQFLSFVEKRTRAGKRDPSWFVGLPLVVFRIFWLEWGKNSPLVLSLLHRQSPSLPFMEERSPTRNRDLG